MDELTLIGSNSIMAVKMLRSCPIVMDALAIRSTSTQASCSRNIMC